MKSKKLKHITFTGVDDFTDISRMIDIQKKYPLVEFGILLSENWEKKGKRYITPSNLSRLKNVGLNLSCHLCGRIARKAIKNDFSYAMNLCDGVFDIFKRCQLNVSTMKTSKTIALDLPCNLNEIILQQKSVDECNLFLNNQNNSQISMLLDASGGRGIDTQIEVFRSTNKIGYAGGISVFNIRNKILTLENSNEVASYWVDMESSLRNESDEFDLDIVTTILQIIEESFNELYKED